MMVAVAAVRINVLWGRFRDQNGQDPQGNEIYEIARWAWCGIQRCPLVFACQARIIRGVYEPDEWFWCAEARNRPELRPYAPEGSERWMEIENDIEE